MTPAHCSLRLTIFLDGLCRVLLREGSTGPRLFLPNHGDGLAGRWRGRGEDHRERKLEVEGPPLHRRLTRGGPDLFRLENNS